MSEKISSRKLKAMETKNKIYNSALELFRTYGIDGVSVNSIVEMAGISKGAFYVHYESKFSLLTEYINSLDLNYEEYFQSIPKDMKASATLILITKKTSDVLKNDIGYSLIKNVYEAMLLQELNPDDILNYNRSLPAIYKRIILKGIDEGEFRTSIDAESLARQFIMSIRGMTFEWCIHSSEFDLENEILNHFKLLLDGILI
ncbi:TetR/AcrR family transcriptional regulator [Clostridium sp. OS1-26]|uniref:TetR/AcrR family transcriptional regulator n=1 Tax=Clostridium sp. OS1-26 TaxID=3070681 RepID=UPI0027E03235|nr:TetR/AcrR family transcriptional regulator [Clostridium sp. OS1-26]WML37733.1 TetR/AcrR family transcriptional regulator [Clostridium sp. OS1-26]